MSLISGAPRAPYALEPTEFPFPGLAAMAGRAPLGGPREVALACFLVARIVRDATGAAAMESEQLAARTQGAKHWLASAALPASIRTPLGRLIEACGADDRNGIRLALAAVMTVTANSLDSGARLELGRLAQAIAG